MKRMTCAEVQELAAELALDLLTGTERAAALAHLERCTACRSEVGSLTDVGEAVLSLAPESEPSAGFEIRVLDRIAAERVARGAGSPAEAPPVPPVPPVPPEVPAEAPAPVPLGDRAPRRSRRRVLAGVVGAAAAAAAVVVAVLVAGGGEPGTGTDDVETAQAAAALRTGSGRVVGEATLTGGDPEVVTLDMADWMTEVRRYGDPDRTFWLTVDAGGTEHDVYGLPTGEPGPWHVRLDEASGAGPVTSVAVVDGTGRSLCEARFATG
jgi:hypothetical protein